jgi:hypothetical protein
VAQWQDPQCHSLAMFLAGESYSAELAGGDASGDGASGDGASGDGASAGATDTAFLVLIHAGTTPAIFTLPGAPYGAHYQCVVDTFTGRSTPAEQQNAAADTVTLQPRSMMVLRAWDGHDHSS